MNLITITIYEVKDAGDTQHIMLKSISFGLDNDVVDITPIHVQI